MNRSRSVFVLAVFSVAAVLLLASPIICKEIKVKVDYSKLFIEGDDHRHDSFSAVMRAAAQLYGKDCDYETIYALSCNGFAPVVHPPENCKQSWFCHGRGQCLDLVADYVGLNVREIKFQEPKPILAANEKRAFWETPEGQAWNKKNADYLKAQLMTALQEGKVVITDGGWSTAPYYLWGFIREVRPNGAVIGTAWTGPQDCELDHFRHLWTVTPGKQKLSLAQADRIMLDRAVARIRGDKAPFAPDAELSCFWGAKAMDLWVNQMKQPAYQPDDPGSSLANARKAAVYQYDGANRVASYLRRRAGTFAPEQSKKLLSAADHYDKIALLLAPYGLSDVGYKPVIGNQPKQIEHADKVLGAVRAEMLAAATIMESVVKIPGATK